MDKDYTCHVQKFNLDDPNDRVTYEDLLNKERDELVKITRDHLSFDRTKGNCALLVVWWHEFN